MAQTFQWPKIRPSNPDPKSDQIRAPKLRDSWAAGGWFCISLQECCEPGWGGPRIAQQIQTPKVIKSGPQIWAILGPQAGRPATDQTAGPPPGQRVGEPARPPAAHLAASRSANQPPSWPACAPGVCCLFASGIKIVETFDRCLLEFARRILAALRMKLSSLLALYCLPQCRAVRKDLWPPWF